jgi:hypothetical protein
MQSERPVTPVFTSPPEGIAFTELRSDSFTINIQCENEHAKMQIMTKGTIMDLSERLDCRFLYGRSVYSHVSKKTLTRKDSDMPIKQGQLMSLS